MVLNFRRFESLIGFQRCEQILNNPEAKQMQGQYIYRATCGIIHFGDQFKRIRSIAAVHCEAAGMVAKSVIPNTTPDEKLCDFSMLDSIMQFTNLLVNYFIYHDDEDFLIYSHIGRFEISGGFNPEADK